jgi:hypothetical protein
MWPSKFEVLPDVLITLLHSLHIATPTPRLMKYFHALLFLDDMIPLLKI